MPRLGAEGVPYERLFEAGDEPRPLDDHSIGSFLRHSMGLSAWKAFRGARWALRVNPSSGNLHPTEAYVVRDGHVCHYAPSEHGLEVRAVLSGRDWEAFTGGGEGFLVALTSIHWREAWKYGERAFRYCQHDVGHAIAALRLAASLFGWSMTPLSRWSDAQIGSLLGIDRETDLSAGAEREAPEYVAAVGVPATVGWAGIDPTSIVAAARALEWHGAANRLSTDHVEWPVIDRVSAATRYPGSSEGSRLRAQGSGGPRGQRSGNRDQGYGDPEFLVPGPSTLVPESVSAQRIILQRRSAVAFDGRSTLSQDRFVVMLSRLQPGGPPWDALDWAPHVHLAIFVHRVEGLVPGLYAYVRDDRVRAEWQSSMRPQFLWKQVGARADDRLFLLLPTDLQWGAMRLSCDQDIAGAGFFSLGMIARLQSALQARGEWFYRRLFWECGVIGQVLYLEAEAAGARATGIGCFYDDPVHDLLGLSGTEWQSLYHFSAGMPVEDSRLTVEPGYPWEPALPTLL